MTVYKKVVAVKLFKRKTEDDAQAEDKPAKKGLLSRMFNKEALGHAAVGAGIMWGAKAATGAVLTLTSAPALTAVAATVATGAVASVFTEQWKIIAEERKAKREAGEEITTSFARDYLCSDILKNKERLAKKAGFNVLAGAVGGSLVVGASNFDEVIDTVKGWKETLLGGTTHKIITAEPDTTALTQPDPTIAEELTGTEALVEPIFDSEQPFTDESVQAITDYDTLDDMPYLDRFGYILDSISPKSEAVERLYNLLENTQPDADGVYSSHDYARMKELAYTAFNGLDGFDQIPEDIREQVAVDLYQAAAEGGNVQAQTDLAYIQYHGLVDEAVPQNQDAALETINKLDKSWVGGEKLLDSYNPETAHLPKIDAPNGNMITSCDVTETTGTLLDNPRYDFSCDAIDDGLAHKNDYVQYNLHNFDIMGEKQVSIAQEFNNSTEKTGFFGKATNKFMSILSTMKAPHLVAAH